MVISRGQVQEWFDNFAIGYSSLDDDFPINFSKLFKSPLLLIGTAEDEFRRSREEVELQYKRDFSEASKIEINITLTDFDTSNDICWCGGLMDIKFLPKANLQWVSGSLRVTAVFQVIKNELLARQMHFSMPHFGSQEGKSFPTIKGINESLQEWIEMFDLHPDALNQLNRDKVKEYLIMAQDLINEEI